MRLGQAKGCSESIWWCLAVTAPVAPLRGGDRPVRIECEIVAVRGGARHEQALHSRKAGMPRPDIDGPGKRNSLVQEARLEFCAETGVGRNRCWCLGLIEAKGRERA